MISFPLPVKIPWVIKKIYPGYLWDRKSLGENTKVLYLTFDDGPIPEITPWVLETLEIYNAKASFFVIGDNVRKHPKILKDIVHANHTLGNHTHNHLKGSKTESQTYLDNVTQAQLEIIRSLKAVTSESEDQSYQGPLYFRPPYGKLKTDQSRALQKDYKIVMYDVLAYDWEEKIEASQCIKNVINHAESGSIVLMHDSLKAAKNLKVCLPAVLSHFTKLGYSFKAL